ENVLGATRVATGNGGDTINVRAANAATTVDGGEDDDVVNVGSVAPGTGGVLTGLSAAVAIAGGLGFDRLNLDSSGTTAGTIGQLSHDTLSGLTLGVALAFDSMDDLRLVLGDFADQFTIASTADDMAVTVMAQGGADQILVEAINGPTTVDGGTGSDTIAVIPSTDSPVDSARVVPNRRSAINAGLLVRGGVGGADIDSLVYRSVFAVTETGRLTGDRLSGLDLPAGIDYRELESLQVVLDTNGDVAVTIEDTHAGSTEILTGSGADIVNIRAVSGPTSVATSGGADAVNVGSRARGVTGDASLNEGGDLKAIAANLVVNGGPTGGTGPLNTSTDVLTVDGSGDTQAATGTLAAVTLNGFGMTGSFQYQAMESVFLTLGSGNDRLTIASTAAGATYQVRGGAGNDTVVAGTGNLETLLGRVRIFGDSGTDQATVDDRESASRADYRIAGGAVTSQSQIGQPDRVFAGVEFDSSLESLSLTGNGSANTFDVSPSPATRFSVDGGLPATGLVPPRLGDTLRIDFSAVSGEVLSWSDSRTGTGLWQFTSGQQPVSFTSIERLNGVDSLAVFSGAGINSSGDVKVYDPKSGLLRFTISSLQIRSDGFRDGIRAVTGDLNGDGVPDVAVSQDFTTNAKVKVFDGITGRQLVSLRPFNNPALCRGVVELAIGDVDGDGWSDLVAGQNCDVSISIRVFSGDPNQNWRQLGAELRPFGAVNTRLASLTMADQDVRGAANRSVLWVGATLDSVTSVRAFRWNNASAFDEVLGSRFNPFGTGTGKSVRLTTGDINGDGVEDLITSLGTGKPPSIRVFDGAKYGQSLGNAFPVFNQAKAVDEVFTDAFDFNGDGLVERITAFDSVGGVVGEVRRFGATGTEAGAFTANMGAFPNLAGMWLVNGQPATISQVGTDLTLTDERGRVTAAKLQSAGQIVTVKYRALAKIDGNVLRFSNGLNWQRLDLTGNYAVAGGIARIQHQGSVIRVWDQEGNLYPASFTAAKTIIVPSLGNLSGQIRAGGIDWSDGSSWRKLDLSTEYRNAAGERFRILSNGVGDVVLGDSKGNASVARWVGPDRLVALDWGGRTGVVRDSRITWSDGSVWLKNQRLNGTTATGGLVAIESRDDQILLSNGSARSRARLVNSQTIYAIDWRLTGVIVDDQIQWSNGTIWKDFGLEAFNSAFRDIVTLPFPNVFLKGDDSRGGAVAIELRQNELFLTDRKGDVAPAVRIATNKIFVAKWNLTGTLVKGKVYWSNATLWRGFDTTLIEYVFKN
ncbi:MAG: beta strand repeat-containing protein, partial [Planctomycetota bacterium]